MSHPRNNVFLRPPYPHRHSEESRNPPAMPVRASALRGRALTATASCHQVSLAPCLPGCSAAPRMLRMEILRQPRRMTGKRDMVDEALAGNVRAADRYRIGPYELDVRT